MISLCSEVLLKRGELETYEEQCENASQVAKDVMDAIEEGYTFVLVYGSGPQLTAELMIQDFTKDLISWPLHANIAKVQGLVGHIIQLALINEAKKRRSNARFATVLTHTLLDSDSTSSRSFCFPVGVFLTKDEMKRRSVLPSKEKKRVFAEVTNGIYRKVVASPEPKNVIEGRIIKKLVADGINVVACLCGGVPIIDRGLYIPVEAVIDRDLISAKIATLVGATTLVFLTHVDGIFVPFSSRQATLLRQVSTSAVRKYCEEGHIKGGMSRKVRASLKFTQFGGKRAIVAPIGKLTASLKGLAGTHILKDTNVVDPHTKAQ